MEKFTKKIQDLSLKCQVWLTQKICNAKKLESKEEKAKFFKISFGVCERLAYLFVGLAVGSGDVRAWILAITTAIILIILEHYDRKHINCDTANKTNNAE